jgi:hypothetical protein
MPLRLCHPTLHNITRTLSYLLGWIVGAGVGLIVGRGSDGRNCKQSECRLTLLEMELKGGSLRSLG